MSYRVLFRTKLPFVRPSFGNGFARGLDLFGSFDTYKSPTTGLHADGDAIAGDWAEIGRDFKLVMEQAKTK